MGVWTLVVGGLSGMKKMIEVDWCDFCGNAHADSKCLCCHKRACYRCWNDILIRYNASPWQLGGGPVWCRDCHQILTKASDPLLVAAERVVALKAEHDRFYKSWDTEARKAEKTLRELMEKTL